MGNLKVSIIVPVYNAEKSLDKCLRSLSHQTLKDLEIICINDGSTDKSGEIIKLWAGVEKRIQIIHQKNAGLSAARNAGLKVAKGEYICFVDSDDWVDEDFCEKLYDTAIRHNADITCATIIRKRKNSEKYRVHYTKEKVYTTLEEKIKCCDIPRCCYVWNKLYKRELIQNKPFKVGAYFEDILWTPSVLKAANKLVTVPDINYYYWVNSSSIVKNNNSKKQADNYNANLSLINFFEENGLELSKKQKNITKKIYYFGKLPLVKIKEYEDKESCLLFGAIPCFNLGKLFFFTDFDSHYIFRLGKIKLNVRHKANIKYNEVNTLGITTEKRTPQIIVSLTSYPARISTIHIVISSLLQQTVKPDKVILWLAESQFPQKEQELPESLLRLKEFGLTIAWCEDLRSYKKLIPALKEHPEDIIITCDDDIYYDNTLVESLYNSYLENPNEVKVRRACNAYIKDNVICCDKFPLEKNLNNEKICLKARLSNQLMSGSGCLFPPHSLHADVLNIETFKTLIPTHDDIYFWAMAVLNKTPIRVVEGFKKQMINIDDTQSSSLAKSNRKGGAGLAPTEAFIRIGNKYPELIKILGEEK